MGKELEQNQPEQVGIEVSRSEGVLPLFDKLVVNDTAIHTSRSFYCAAFRKFLLYLYILSSGAPTNIHIEVQFLNANDGQWYTYKQGLFASLYYEDTDTANGIRECYSGDCLGREMRVLVTGSGTDGSNTFTIIPSVEFLN